MENDQYVKLVEIKHNFPQRETENEMFVCGSSEFGKLNQEITTSTTS